MARHLHRLTGLPRLCLAVGVGLNCVANYKGFRDTPFETIERGGAPFDVVEDDEGLLDFVV